MKFIHSLQKQVSDDKTLRKRLGANEINVALVPDRFETTVNYDRVQVDSDQSSSSQSQVKSPKTVKR